MVWKYLLFYITILNHSVVSCVCIIILDYDAPLSEAGDMTAKFKALKEVLKKYNVDALYPSKMKQQTEKF